MVSYYQILGVDESASQDKIKQAYRQMMRVHHSDRHGQTDDPIVPLITEAYRVLSDTTEREQYNKRLHWNGNSSSAAIEPRQSSPVMAPPLPRNRELCNECKGYGFNPRLGVKWKCQYCGGQGWVPGKIAL